MNPVAIARILLPPAVVAFLDRLAARARPLLQGEPLRAIVYGAAVVAWGVTFLARLAGYETRAIDLDAALAAATVAGGILTELARRWVYSPATVEAILEEKSADVPQPQPA